MVPANPLVPQVCSLLAAVAGANIHPAGGASFTVGGPHLVVNRGDTGGAQRVDVTQGALIVALGLGNLFLSQGGAGHSQGRSEQSSDNQLHRGASKRAQPTELSD